MAVSSHSDSRGVGYWESARFGRVRVVRVERYSFECLRDGPHRSTHLLYV